MLFLSGLLHAERIRRGTRTGSRALSTYKQAVLALRWLFDDTRMIQLARDNDIGVSTAYDYRDEALTVLAARKPSLHGALLAAKAAGHTHVDRGRHPDLHRPELRPRPHPRGGSVVVGQAPPPRRATSRSSPPPTAGRCGPPTVRPGREHDTTAARADPDLLDPDRAPGSTTASSAWPTWATKARPRSAAYPDQETDRRCPQPSTSRPTTPSTAPCGRSANAPTAFTAPSSLPRTFQICSGSGNRLAHVLHSSGRERRGGRASG